MSADPPEVILHTFNAYADGVNPSGPLMQGQDGNLYGTTAAGGTNNDGTVFRITTEGVVTTIHSFVIQESAEPIGKLTQGTDGSLYGVTSLNAIYKLNPDGSNLQVLYRLNTVLDGISPVGGVILGQDGALYGMTYQDGPGGYGTIFRATTDGFSFTLLHSFIQSDGSSPQGRMVQGQNGKLYGVTLAGGPDGGGVLCSVNTDGTHFTIVHSFLPGNNANPVTLTAGPNDTLFGTTVDLVTTVGTLFQIKTSGTDFKTLHTFGNDGVGNPSNEVTVGKDGKLYGTTLAYNGPPVYGSVYEISADGFGFQVLHSFTNADVSNASPSGLILGRDGILYGTTYLGGNPLDVGTVFSLTTNGTFKAIYEFTNNYQEGKEPELLKTDKAGNWYFATQAGGHYGDGVLYKITPSGTLTPLHDFTNQEGSQPNVAWISPEGTIYGVTNAPGGPNTIFLIHSDGTGLQMLHSFVDSEGNSPSPYLTHSRDGYLYGTTAHGDSTAFFGSIFRIRTDGSGFEVLHRYPDEQNGGNPSGILVGRDGKLYGSTYDGSVGYGTIFRMDRSGRYYTVIHRFDADNDGFYPAAGLVQDSGDRLYGTTTEGGNALGTVFALNPDGSGFQILHRFSYSEGGTSIAPLILASDGRLYGTLSRNGVNNTGSIFQLGLDGSSFSILHAFGVSGTDGITPIGLAEGIDGNLYGTTYSGGIAPEPGTYVSGTFYRLETWLPRITSFTPSHGTVGTTVTVIGVNLTAATVTLNGTAQTVIAESDTKLSFQINQGTSSGLIVITTSNGTTHSTKPFKVIPR